MALHDIRIATWNMQGSPFNNVNRQAMLNQLLATHEVVLLQECGDLASQHEYNGFIVHGNPQIGAFNNRCGLAILYRGDSPIEGLGQEYFSNTGRLLLWIQFDKVFIACVHCESSDNAGTDRSAAAEVMLTVSKEAFDGKIIIGGDFNVQPNGPTLKTINNDNRGRLTRLNQKMQRRNFTFAVPAEPTHQGDPYNPDRPKRAKVLDYFLWRGNRIEVLTAPTVMPLSFKNEFPLAPAHSPSDHKWVSATFRYDDNRDFDDSDDDSDDKSSQLKRGRDDDNDGRTPIKKIKLVQ